MKLSEAMEILSILKEYIERHILPVHRYDVKQALDLGISALKTIEDGDYQLKSNDDRNRQLKNRLNAIYGTTGYKDTDSAGLIDLKTLYEQTTAICELINKYHAAPLHFEVYQQPDTPILVYVAWKNHKIYSITYTLKEK